MTCHQHDFTPWVDIPQTFNPFKVRWMSYVRYGGGQPAIPKKCR